MLMYEDPPQHTVNLEELEMLCFKRLSVLKLIEFK